MKLMFEIAIGYALGKILYAVFSGFLSGAIENTKWYKKYSRMK